MMYSVIEMNRSDMTPYAWVFCSEDIHVNFRCLSVYQVDNAVDFEKLQIIVE